MSAAAIDNLYVKNATLQRGKIGSNQLAFGNTVSEATKLVTTGVNKTWAEVVGVPFSLDGTANLLGLAGSSYDGAQAPSTMWWSLSPVDRYQYRLVLKQGPFGGSPTTIIATWQFEPTYVYTSGTCGMGETYPCDIRSMTENQVVSIMRGSTLAGPYSYRLALEVRANGTNSARTVKIDFPYVSALINYATGV
jgi:hypothetical protein